MWRECLYQLALLAWVVGRAAHRDYCRRYHITITVVDVEQCGDVHVVVSKLALPSGETRAFRNGPEIPRRSDMASASSGEPEIYERESDRRLDREMRA